MADARGTGGGDMFGLENLDGWKLMVLLLLGIFIFGPDKLPKAIADGVKMLRNVRNMARNATTDLNRELGTDLQLEDLNPKALLRKHLLSEEDEATLRKPLEDLYREVESDVKGLHADIKDTTTAALSTESATPAPAVPATPARKMIDTDAT